MRSLTAEERALANVDAAVRHAVATFGVGAQEAAERFRASISALAARTAPAEKVERMRAEVVEAMCHDCGHRECERVSEEMRERCAMRVDALLAAVRREAVGTTWGYAAVNNAGVLATLHGDPMLVTVENARVKGWDDDGRKYAEAWCALANAHTTDPRGPFTLLRLVAVPVSDDGAAR